MFSLGFSEILVILVISLLVFGPKRLPEIARSLGKTLGELRRTLDDIKHEVTLGQSEPPSTPSERLAKAGTSETARLENSESQNDNEDHSATVDDSSATVLNPSPSESSVSEESQNAESTETKKNGSELP